MLLFQHESVQNFPYEIEFDLHEKRNYRGTHFHMNSFGRRLVLTQRQKATRNEVHRFTVQPHLLPSHGKSDSHEEAGMIFKANKKTELRFNRFLCKVENKGYLGLFTCVWDPTPSMK